ncbi:hypothetical protein BH20CHL7_BH20CHL7_01660 [soil metagenome]
MHQLRPTVLGLGWTVASNVFIGSGKEKAEYQCKVEVYPRLSTL